MSTCTHILWPQFLAANKARVLELGSFVLQLSIVHDLYKLQWGGGGGVVHYGTGVETLLLAFVCWLNWTFSLGWGFVERRHLNADGTGQRALHT